MVKNHKFFFIILFLALLLRILLLIWSVTYPLDLNGDQSRYEDWAQSAHIYGLAKTYEPGYTQILVNHMPPGTLYVASGAYESYVLAGKVINKLTDTAAGSLHWVNTYLFHSMMRFPGILADLAIGILLYLIVRKESTAKRGILAASLVWFNPVIIYNSTIWGQMDGITNFFFVSSLFLAFQKQYILSILTFAGSIFIKFSLLPLFPFYFIFLYFLSGKQWKKILIGLALAAAVTLAATYPISANPFSWWIEYLPTFTKGEWQNMSIVAFNFWWAILCVPWSCDTSYMLPLSTSLVLGIPLSTWSYLLFVLLAVPVLYFQITKAKQFIKPYYAFFAFALISLAVFLVMPRMHDRYLYPFFPLFSGVVALSKHPRQYVLFYCTLTVLHFANLLSSWYPTRYPAQIYAEINYNVWYRWSISVLTVISGVLLYVSSVKSWFLYKVKRDE